MSLLEVVGLGAGYDDFQALSELDVRVDEGETVSIIGANGAGKSTLLGAVAGLVRCSAGQIVYDGVSLRGIAAFRRVGMGIAMVPEGRRIFPSLTVDENLDVGRYCGRPGPWTKSAVYEALPLLQRLRSRSGARLSGGEQQTLAIGRALMANPRLLLLDEVSLGLAPVVVKQVYEAVPAIRAGGTTLLIVEQDVNQALAVADRVYCLLEGRLSLEGVPAHLSRDEITAAYFGIGSENGTRP